MNLTIVMDEKTKQVKLVEVPDQEQIWACATVIYGPEGRNRMGMTMCDSFVTNVPEEIIKGMGAVQPLEKVRGVIEVTWYE